MHIWFNSVLILQAVKNKFHAVKNKFGRDKQSARRRQALAGQASEDIKEKPVESRKLQLQE